MADKDYKCSCKRLEEYKKNWLALKQLFEKQHSRTEAADKLWQETHGKPDVLPDLGELIDWLMARHDAVAEEVKTAKNLLANFNLTGEDSPLETRVNFILEVLRHTREQVRETGDGERS